jgi:hypothetical protein
MASICLRHDGSEEFASLILMTLPENEGRITVILRPQDANGIQYGC